MHGCMYARVYVYMHACMHVRMCIVVDTHMYMCVYMLYPYTHTYVQQGMGGVSNYYVSSTGV